MKPKRIRVSRPELPPMLSKARHFAVLRLASAGLSEREITSSIERKTLPERWTAPYVRRIDGSAVKPPRRRERIDAEDALEILLAVTECERQWTSRCYSEAADDGIKLGLLLAKLGMAEVELEKRRAGAAKTNRAVQKKTRSFVERAREIERAAMPTPMSKKTLWHATRDSLADKRQHIEYSAFCANFELGTTG